MGCGNCAYEIGPIDNPYTCVSSRYSDTRILPPFDASETATDRRDWGVVQTMQDQGVCGSCYSFSTIAAAESAYAIMTGDLYKLTEQ
jgi:C1A family cysteine protease